MMKKSTDDKKQKTEENKGVSPYQIDFLKSSIEETLKSYQIKRTRNKVGCIVVQSSVIVFSVATTVFIGWKLGGAKADNSFLLNIALICSAISAGLSTLEKFFDYKALWVRYNLAIQHLKFIKNRLKYMETMGVEHLKLEQIQELFKSYEEICFELMRQYESIRQEAD